MISKTITLTKEGDEIVATSKGMAIDLIDTTAYLQESKNSYLELLRKGNGGLLKDGSSVVVEITKEQEQSSNRTSINRFSYSVNGGERVLLDPNDPRRHAMFVLFNSVERQEGSK